MKLYRCAKSTPSRVESYELSRRKFRRMGQIDKLLIENLQLTDVCICVCREVTAFIGRVYLNVPC